MKRAALVGFWFTFATACAPAPATHPVAVEQAPTVLASPPRHDHAGHPHGRLSSEPAANGAAAPSAVSFRQAVVPVLRRHCAECHTAGRSGAAGLAMFDAAGEPQHQAIRDQLGHMLLEIQAGRMPQGKPYSMPEADFQVLDRWGASDMRDN